MEIDRVEKGKQRGKSKGKSKDKNNFKGKGKGKNEKGKGKSSQPSQRAATANDQCLHCGRYGHFKRDCWKLHGKPDSKKVNQVESQTATSTATSSSGGGPSISPPSTAAASSVRLFTSLDHMHGPLIEDLDDLEVCDLTMHDSSGFCNMVSQMHNGLDTLDSTCDGVYMECCECFDMSYSDSDSNWTICDFSDDTALQTFQMTLVCNLFLAFVKEMMNHCQSEQLAILSQEMWRWYWTRELMALCCRWSTPTLASQTLHLMVLHLLMHKVSLFVSKMPGLQKYVSVLSFSKRDSSLLQ